MSVSKVDFGSVICVGRIRGNLFHAQCLSHRWGLSVLSIFCFFVILIIVQAHLLLSFPSQSFCL